MKKVLILLIAVSLLTSIPAFAQFSWQLYDFGTGPFDHNNNISPIDYSQVFPNMDPFVPSPGQLGEGGEKFDLEGLHFAKVEDMVHVAITNSFGLNAYSTGWGETFPLGDIFFGFNGSSYDYAIDVSEGTIVEVNSYYMVSDNPYGLGGTYAGYGLDDEIGGTFIENGDVIGSLANFYDGSYDLGGIEDNTHVLEFAFNADIINGFSDFSTVSFHNTLGCGNDVMDETFPAVPEPTALLLFGLGSLGLAAIRRKRQQ